MDLAVINRALRRRCPVAPTGSVRIPSELQVICPKCGAGNVGRKTYVWEVADERGLHHECDVCSHAWPSHRTA